jgi:16S rRNA (uracil1498-N3)-methyltransferase
MVANLPGAMEWSITSPRLFVPQPLHEGATLAGSAAQAHHLGAVLRLQPGDAVRLFNGVDGEWAARITALRRDRLALAAAAQLRAQQAEPDLWLAFAALKRDRTDLVVEKATELGAAALLPVITERTVAARLNLDRLAAIATAAAEQCERLSVPRIAAPVALAALLRDWPAGRRLVAAVERRAAAAVPAGSGPAALLVGPEGGFTVAELELLDQRAFVVMASLGCRILRSETAAIVGLALLQATAGG